MQRQPSKLMPIPGMLRQSTRLSKEWPANRFVRHRSAEHCMSAETERFIGTQGTNGAPWKDLRHTTHLLIMRSRNVKLCFHNKRGFNNQVPEIREASRVLFTRTQWKRESNLQEEEDTRNCLRSAHSQPCRLLPQFSFYSLRSFFLWTTLIIHLIVEKWKDQIKFDSVASWPSLDS